MEADAQGMNPNDDSLEINTTSETTEELSPVLSIESENTSMIVATEDVMSGADDAPTSAEGDSSGASVDYVSPTPQSPPGRGGGDTPKRRESAFAGFFKNLSPRKKNAEKVLEVEQEDEHTETERTAGQEQDDEQEAEQEAEQALIAKYGELAHEQRIAEGEATAEGEERAEIAEEV
jgi:hypothetical protein